MEKNKVKDKVLMSNHSYESMKSATEEASRMGKAVVSNIYNLGGGLKGYESRVLVTNAEGDAVNVVRRTGSGGVTDQSPVESYVTHRTNVGEDEGFKGVSYRVINSDMSGTEAPRPDEAHSVASIGVTRVGSKGEVFKQQLTGTNAQRAAEILNNRAARIIGEDNKSDNDVAEAA